MTREFTIEGLTIYYHGDKWIAVSDTGVEASSETPFTRVTEGLDEDSQAWGKSVTTQIKAKMEAEDGIPYQGQAPPEAVERMTAWGWQI